MRKLKWFSVLSFWHLHYNFLVMLMSNLSKIERYLLKIISLHTELFNKFNYQRFDNEINISVYAVLSTTLSLTDDVVGAQGRLPCPPDLQSHRISQWNKIKNYCKPIFYSRWPFPNSLLINWFAKSVISLTIKKFTHFITLARVISLSSLYLHRHRRHSRPDRTHIIWWWTSHTAVT